MPNINSRPSEPPVPPQPVSEPILPEGQKAIPLYRRVGGSNRHPHSLRFSVICYTVVDQMDYEQFACYRWLAFWSENRRSYVPVRIEHIGSDIANVYLAREILGLPRNPGRGCTEEADHIDHNPLNNIRGNLRVATRTENGANQRRRRNANTRFRGVCSNGSNYQVNFRHGGKFYYLGTIASDSEAAFMFNHAVRLLRDPHAQVNDIPTDELLSPQRQAELTALVENKLRAKGLIP